MACIKGLLMVDRQQKNFKLPTYVYDLLEDYLENMARRGAFMRHNEVAAAALHAFFESDEDTQFTLLSQVRNHDLEALRSSRYSKKASRVMRRDAGARRRPGSGGRKRRRKCTKTT